MGGYIPGTEQEQQEMLAEIGFSSMEELFGHIPDEVKVKGGLQIPEGMSELEVRRAMEKIAEKTRYFQPFSAEQGHTDILFHRLWEVSFPRKI